jgi:hypothetical protein
MDSTMKKVLILGGLALAGYVIYTKFIAPGASSLPGSAATPQLDSGTLQILNSWAESGGSSAPQLSTFVNSLQPSEGAFLADLIVNYWGKGIAPSYAQDDEWNALKAKYGVS